MSNFTSVSINSNGEATETTPFSAKVATGPTPEGDSPIRFNLDAGKTYTNNPVDGTSEVSVHQQYDTVKPSGSIIESARTGFFEGSGASAILKAGDPKSDQARVDIGGMTTTLAAAYAMGMVDFDARADIRL